MAMWCGRVFFFFNDTATTEIYTLSLHDALPISLRCARRVIFGGGAVPRAVDGAGGAIDRKSTRLNSSHANISYAVFCLKKKNNIQRIVQLSDGAYLAIHSR